MNRNFEFSEGEFYHVYSRGVDKRKIYLDDNDSERFCKLLYISNSEKGFELSVLSQDSFFSIDRGLQLVDICAYCLMPNHFHLILRQKCERGISLFMKKLLTGYAMYFNARNERGGALFQGKFKAKHISTDEYLRHVPLYVHMNSVDLIETKSKENGITYLKKTEEFMIRYPYSSFPDFAGVDRDKANIINKGALPPYYSSLEERLEDLKDWLVITPEISHLIK